MPHKAIAYLLVCLFLFAVPVGSVRANETGTMQHAAAYVDLFEFEPMIRSILKAEFAKQKISTKQSDIMIDEVYKKFRMAMIESMAKVFTSEELAALVDFYSSPLGRTIAKKQMDMDKHINAAMENLLRNIEKK